MAIDTILAAVKWQFVLVYVDVTIVFLLSLEQHMDHLRTVLALFKEASIILRLSKSNLFQKEVDYLGHVIKSGAL